MDRINLGRFFPKEIKLDSWGSQTLVMTYSILLLGLWFVSFKDYIIDTVDRC